MSMDFDTWLRAVDGRYIDRDGGFPARDPYQCWDLWADYAERVHGVPIAATYTNHGGTKPHSGLACNVLHNAHRVPAILAAFDVIGPGETAREGDVAFWEAGTAYRGSHVAIVLEDVRPSGRAALRCMSQNRGPGHDPALVETLSTRDLLGFLRPKRTKATAPAAPATTARKRRQPMGLVRTPNGAISLTAPGCKPVVLKNATERELVQRYLQHIALADPGKAFEINDQEHMMLSSILRSMKEK